MTFLFCAHRKEMAELKSVAHQAKFDVERVENSLSERLEVVERMMRYHSNPSEEQGDFRFDFDDLFRICKIFF